MKICVIGTGYVGLVTGACLADFGNNVVCVDKDGNKISNFKKGIIGFYELGLKELIQKNVKSGRLIFSKTLADAVRSSQVIFIAVGTPPLPNGDADLTAIEEVSRDLSKILKKIKNGSKVIAVKSTVPVGTSEFVERILIENRLNPRRFKVVSNPEFLREGKAVQDFLHPDRIVIGSSDTYASNLMAELYRPLNARIVFMDRRSSELVKYASNAFLATRISFINEIANICEIVNANVKSVIEGMGYDKRIGHEYMKPGIGFGGSCLPKDITALTHMAEKNGYEAVLLKGVAFVNQRQRERFVEKIIKILNGVKGKTVAIWGLAFKPQTDDLRDAPSLYILDRLLREGAKLRVYDPMANHKVTPLFSEVRFAQSSYEAAKGSEAVIILTEWNEFREVDFEKLKMIMSKPLIIDGRNILNPKVIKEFGIKYYGLGVGVDSFRK